MNQNEFEILVKRLEVYAQEKPGTYKLKVGLLAILGYAYIFLVLAALIAAIALLVIIIIYAHSFNIALIKLFIFLIIPAFIIVRSLFVRIPPPQGLTLHRREVPELFALIDELRRTLSSMSINHVILTRDFNAAVAQVPILGLFGWQQSYLIIGLPLLQALSPQQFKAVLAHEFGHLSGNHSRFSAWIYRVRQTVTQIFQRLQNSESQGAYILFARFFDWYYPFFNAYSFVLARSNEYEADHCAAELAGSQNIAEALINVEVKSPFITNTFWNQIYEQTKEQSEPPTTPFNSLATALHTIDPNEQEQSFEQAIARQTDLNDTHPCLRDRLTALGYSLTSVSLPTSITENAAQYYLGEALPKLTEILNQEWLTQVNYQWHERYSYLQKLRQSLGEIEAKAATTELTIDDTWNRAYWTLELEGNQAAIPLLHEVLQLQADHAASNYILGKILITQNDEAGIGYLEAAMSKDIEIVIEGCQIIYNFLCQQGREAEANQYLDRAKIHQQNLLNAQQERSGVWSHDNFEPHNLSPEEKQQLKDQLATYPGIKEAYLVKKVVRYFPERPFYLLLIKRQFSWWKIESENANQELLKRLTTGIKFPYYFWIMVFSGRTTSVSRKICQTTREAIYDRNLKK